MNRYIACDRVCIADLPKHPFGFVGRRGALCSMRKWMERFYRWGRVLASKRMLPRETVI